MYVHWRRQLIQPWRNPVSIEAVLT